MFSAVSNLDRLDKLDDLIEELFGDDAMDEVGDSSRSYTKTETHMLEIVELREQDVLVVELFEDIEFTVTFPDQLVRLLRPKDVFLGKIGLRERRWEVIYMSPLYESV